MDFSPLWISLKVAVCATAFTFFLGLLSARLVLSLRAGKALIDGIFSLFPADHLREKQSVRRAALKNGNQCAVHLAGGGDRGSGGIFSHHVPDSPRRPGAGGCESDLCGKDAGNVGDKDFFPDSAAGGMARGGGCHDSGICQGYGGIRCDDHVSRKYSRKDTDHVGGNLHGSAER